MDTRTGEIISNELLGQLPAEESKHFIPVIRDLSIAEELNRQINLYSPCACGSGNKFKFCCFNKPSTPNQSK